MRLHLLGFPHTRATAEFAGCAYTQKVCKMLKMLEGICDITLYATEGSDPQGADMVEVLSDAERQTIFGKDDHGRLPAWPTDEQWAVFNANAAQAIKERIDFDKDLVLLTAGWSQHPIAHALPQAICCEPGVGYEGTFTPFCAFESYAWMHYLYGKRRIGDGHWGNDIGVQDGRWYDTVIPNYFDPDEFPLLNGGEGEYLLFVGRLIRRKGLSAAADIANAAGLPLYVAGAGATSWSEGEIIAPEVTIRGDVHYVGPVGIDERAELMAGAKALLAPTTYIEPFGGVAVEAMMAGTPAITSDWGAFSETVPSVWRFRTLQGALDALEASERANPAAIRDYARARFALTAVAPQFVDWFERLDGLRREGWYERKPTGIVPLAEEVSA